MEKQVAKGWESVERPEREVEDENCRVGVGRGSLGQAMGPVMSFEGHWLYRAGRWYRRGGGRGDRWETRLDLGCRWLDSGGGVVEPARAGRWPGGGNLAWLVGPVWEER